MPETTVVCARLAADVVERIDAAAASAEITRADVVSRAIDKCFGSSDGTDWEIEVDKNNYDRSLKLLVADLLSANRTLSSLCDSWPRMSEKSKAALAPYQFALLRKKGDTPKLLWDLLFETITELQDNLLDLVEKRGEGYKLRSPISVAKEAAEEAAQ